MNHGNLPPQCTAKKSVSTVHKERILLIGGAGFLGAYLARECLRANMAVRVIGRAAAPMRIEKGDYQYFSGDYRNAAFLEPILKSCDMVVHLAHDSIRPSIVSDMSREIEQNIQPAINLISACVHQGIARFVLISSGGTVYGNNSSREPIAEKASTRAITSYGCSKLILEQIGYLSHVQNKLPFIVARPANAYGPGQRPFMGQGLVATAFASALKGQPLNIFGDGSATRDYIHAQDIAEGLLALIQRGQPGETYNIGTAKGIALQTLIDEYINPIAGADGFQLACEYLPARSTDVAYNVLANTKLESHTGFSPKIDLGNGLRETWAWIKHLGNLGSSSS